MDCRNEMARGIVNRGAGYLPAVKENQGQLYQNVRDLFEAGNGTGLDGFPHDYATTPDTPPPRTSDTGAPHGGSAGLWMTRTAWNTWTQPETGRGCARWSR